MPACAEIAGLALLACLARDPACLPPALSTEFPRLRDDLAAIAEQESGFRPWAVRDETTRESLFPPTRAIAEALVARRVAAGHVLGVGLMQITGEANWRRHGLTLATMLDPCANLAAGAAHFADNLRSAARQLYNSGRTTGAPAYAAAVAERRARLMPALAAMAPSPPPSDAAPAAPIPPASPYPTRRAGRQLIYASPSHGVIP